MTEQEEKRMMDMIREYYVPKDLHKALQDMTLGLQLEVYKLKNEKNKEKQEAEIKGRCVVTL